MHNCQVLYDALIRIWIIIGMAPNVRLDNKSRQFFVIDCIRRVTNNAYDIKPRQDWLRQVNVFGTSGLYFPLARLAAAMIEQRACNVVTIPALDIEMDCCSIASWIEVLRKLFLSTCINIGKNTGPILTLGYTDQCLSSYRTRRSSILLYPPILEHPHLKTTLA